MADRKEEHNQRFPLAKPKCKLCKKKDRIDPERECVDRLRAKMDAKAKDAALLDRSEIESLKQRSFHVQQLQAGHYCERCVAKIETWVE